MLHPLQALDLVDITASLEVAIPNLKVISKTHLCSPLDAMAPLYDLPWAGQPKNL